MRHQHNPKLFDPSRAHVLDDADRREWLPPGLVADALDLRPGTSVADLGAGTGYFATVLAERVGPAGRVYAVDMQAEMLERLREKLAGSSLPVTPVLGRAEETTLPSDSVDLVFVANVWHELDEPALLLTEARRIMRLDGRLAILDWRADVPPPPGPPAWHRQAATDVAATLKRERWQARSTRNVGQYSYLVLADLR